MLKLQANMLAKTTQSAKSQFVDKGWLVNSEDGFTIRSCYLLGCFSVLTVSKKRVGCGLKTGQQTPGPQILLPNDLKIIPRKFLDGLNNTSTDQPRLHTSADK